MASTSGTSNTVGVRRSGRTVRAPKRDLEDTLSSTSAKDANNASTSTSRTPRKLKRPKFESDEDYLADLLSNPKSPLTTMDIRELLNAENWCKLSDESRAQLAPLLPPTAFRDFVPSLHPLHPARKTQIERQRQRQQELEAGPSTGASISSAAITEQDPVPTSSKAPDLLDPTVFSEPNFVAAALTFQDHLYSGYMTEAHKAKVERYKRGLVDGTLHAPWKDEVWEQEHALTAEVSDRAGDAAELKLVDLAKHEVIQVGDILAYSRRFPNLDVMVEKDLLVEGIHPKNYSLTLAFTTGREKDLPMSMLPREPQPTGSTCSVTVTNPSMLENAVLDSDGRVPKNMRPSGNAWKTFTLHRWRQDFEMEVGEDMMWTLPRGGRESHGTLFYLRGSLYHDM
ncbi:hypothetical protein PUNSTDRAFT_124709 [Punctularia strigosozonata HHB-11173 SS5]|uniref:uncharacterized protein n=1 Tax=Punctularia strigosozonata (strain HHB-11173) TaxID=741275 RepID=UPI0004416ADB|nr:uncharacterized protein PUNSTDRAFT_124709 [Punctularia strigosozonata HHB-11173 SS5]EIN11273.1 hypothetical protein PUNSTDRAFT_124709 [Punctularia strigosozonata HHB-11173 SS5]